MKIFSLSCLGYKKKKKICFVTIKKIATSIARKLYLFLVIESFLFFKDNIKQKNSKSPLL